MKTLLSLTVLAVSVGLFAPEAGAQCDHCRSGFYIHVPSVRVVVVPAPIVQRSNQYYQAPNGQLWTPRRVGVFGWRVRWYPVPRAD
jgi:hypothetical protein